VFKIVQVLTFIFITDQSDMFLHNDSVSEAVMCLVGLLQLLEDTLQMHRLRYVIDGREGDMRDEHIQGMLGQ